MRIKSLQIDNFIGIKNLALNPLGQLTLICGPNKVGKTSLRQAISFALLGIPERVRLKKEYGVLIHDEADEALICADLGENQSTVRLSKKSGKANGIPNPDNISQFVHTAIDMTRFTTMDDNDRRKLLFQLMNISTSYDDIMHMLRTGGGNMDKVAKLKNILKAGFEAGANAATEYASDARKEWTKVAGEKYGTDKAEKIIYSPKKHANVEKLEKEYAALKEDAELKDSALKNEIARLKQMDNLAGLEVELPDFSEEVLREGIEANERNIAIRQKHINELNQKIGIATGKASAELICPDCSALLSMENCELVAYQEPEFSNDDIEGWKRDILENEERIRDHKDANKDAKDDLAKYEKRRHYEELKGQLDTDDHPPLVDYQDNALAATDAMGAASDKLIDAMNIRAENRADKTKIDTLYQLHNDNLEWSHIAKQLSPEGIPGVLLEKSLEPFNVCLTEQAKSADWPVVQVDKDMQITYGDRQYWLLSESEQWRCQAMIAAAISYLSGVNFLLLDRMDVLDIRGRGQMMLWLQELVEKRLQIVVCATLKIPPSVEWVDVVWLEG